MADFIIRKNAEQSDSYNPYCGRCNGFSRMQKIGFMQWNHHCGAIHDERTEEEQKSTPTMYKVPQQ